MDCVDCLLLENEAAKKDIQKNKLHNPRHINSIKDNSVFCEEHQPKVGPAMVAKGGCFIPRQGLTSGDPELAAEAKSIYDLFGFSMDCDHHNCEDGELCPKRYYKSAGHYDGVSVTYYVNGDIKRRVALTDFFSKAFRVVTHDII